MSSAGLKDALKHILKRTGEGSNEKDSQARKDINKVDGQLWLINREHQAAVVYAETGIRLTRKERHDLFQELDKFYKAREVKTFANPQQKGAATRAKNKAKKKPGDFVYIITNFDRAKYLKFKTANPTNSSQIMADFVNNSESAKKQNKSVSAEQISSFTQVGHGERGVAASSFSIDRAISEAKDKFNLTKAEVTQLRTIATKARIKHKVKANLKHSQYLDTKGRFKKNYSLILSSQYYKLNSLDKDGERAASQDALNEYKAILVNKQASTVIRDAIGQITLELLAGNPSKNKKVTGKRKKSIKEDSKADTTYVREREREYRYELTKGVPVQGLINTPKKAKPRRRDSFVQLQGLLNAKLPQTVAKNMGAPRLENRTGTFASSVRVTEVQKTPQGFASIGYTYQKDPYSVFENTSGTRFASAERDPRDLINLSIREIAQQMAIGRFYTRRV